MPILGVIASSIQHGTPFTPTGSYDYLASYTVPSGGVANITFAGIPNTYEHLQLRMITSSANGDTEGYIEYNGDYTSSNYYYHRLFGNGSVAGSGAGAGAYIFNGWQTGLSNSFVASVVDILDYSSTLKNKTTRCLTGFDTNGGSNSSWIAGNSTLWNSTAAISSIRIRMNSNNFNQYTQVSLYGVKG